MQKSFNPWKLSSILLLALSLGLLWTNANPEPEAAKSEENPKEQIDIEAAVEAEAAAGDETLLANIKGFSLVGGELYAQVDDLEWLSSSDGTCTQDSSAKREAMPEVQNPVLPYCNPNGFLLQNADLQVKLIPLTPDVQVRLMEETGNSYDAQALTLQEFMEGKNEMWQSYYVFVYDDGVPYYPPFNLIFKDGKLLTIHQVYVP